MREVDGRLARRQQQGRNAPPQGVHQQKGSRALPEKNEGAGGHREAAPYQTAREIALAWAAASPPWREIWYAARQLAEALDGADNQLPEPIVRDLVAAWRKRYAPITVFNRCNSLRKILRSIDQRTGTRLAAEVSIPRRHLPRQRTATDEELRAIHDHANPTMKMFLALASVMALRLAEIQRLGWRNYNREKQTITVETKGHKLRTFPVPGETAKLIALCPQGDASFIELLEGRQLRRHAIYRRWRALLKKAGITRNLNPHDLRRTAAVRAYVLTKDVFASKALLGHEKLASTAWYLTPHEPAAMRDIAERLQTWTPRGRVQ